MEDTFFLAPIDWSLYQDLRQATQPRFDRPAVTAALGAAAAGHSPGEADTLARYEALGVALPPALILPLGLRVAPDRYRAQTVDWLETLEAETLQVALTDLAQAAEEMESGIESTVFLSYFSEAYRRIVVGLEEGLPGHPGRYDGPEALRQAVGGYLFPDRTEWVLYPPDTCRQIADGLDAVDDSQYPTGDVGALNRFLTDRIDDGPTVEETCPAHFAVIKSLYRDAAGHNFGMRVYP